MKDIEKEKAMRLKFLFTAVFVSSLVCSAAKPAPEVTLSVMSYNIRLGTANDGTNSWMYRYPATLMMLEDVQPDVVGLQEAMDFQILMITENHEQYEAVGVGRDDGKKEGEQTAIVYNKKKIALQKWGTFWLSDTPDSPSKGWDAACKRTATWALMKCKKTGRKFYFVNTHLDHVGEEAREKGLALVVGRINSMNKDQYPVVLTGDFNMKAGHRSFSGLESMMKNARTSAETTDTHHSYNGWGKSSSVIDYIYYSGFSACRKFSTVTKPYAERKFISDHFPISAELVF